MINCIQALVICFECEVIFTLPKIFLPSDRIKNTQHTNHTSLSTFSTEDPNATYISILHRIFKRHNGWKFSKHLNPAGSHVIHCSNRTSPFEMIDLSYFGEDSNFKF